MPHPEFANDQMLQRERDRERNATGAVGVEFEKRLAKIRSDHAPTLLLMLKAQYQAKDIAPATISKITGISRDRLGKLYNSLGQEEPWLDEAIALHRVLGTMGVNQLISASGTLTDVPMGYPTDGDVDALRAGFRLPLSMACRLTIRFGLDDPSELIPTAREVEAWARVENGAHVAYDMGIPLMCPSCLGRFDPELVSTAYPRGRVRHLATCLPDILWGARNVVDQSVLAFTPYPAGSRPNKRGVSRKAPGLLPLREKLGMTQAQFARGVGLDGSYYARIERGDTPLTLRNAERIAAHYRVDLHSLFVEVQP